MIKHLREYLRDYNEHGGIDQLIIAHAHIGPILWNQSLPGKAGRRLVREDHSRARDRARRSRAREGQQIHRAAAVRPGLEDQADGRQARRIASSRRRSPSSRRSTNEWDKHQGKISEEPLTRPARATSTRRPRLSEADQDFEKYLDTKFPTGLNFDPE